MSQRTPRTPASTRRPPRASPTSPAELSAIRRGEEKAELSELNQRLEMYILKIRENADSQGLLKKEIETIREKYRTEAERDTGHYRAQLEQLQSEHAEVVAENARLSEVSESNAAEIKRLSDTLEQTREDLDDARAARDDAAKKLHDVEVDLKSANETIEYLRQELQQEKEKNKDYIALKKSEAKARQKADTLAADLKQLQEKYKEDRDHFETETEKWITKTTTWEKGAQFEAFKKKQEEYLQQRLMELQKEKEEGFAALKAEYFSKFKEYRDHLERAGHELDEWKRKAKTAEANVADVEEYRLQIEHATSTVEEWKTKYDEVLAELDLEREANKRAKKEKESMEKKQEDLLERITILQRKTTIADPSSDRHKSRETIRRLKAAFKRKEEEIDLLTDKRIALYMEIKAYRKLLEQEEARLGYASPGKKRKLENGATETKSSSFVDDGSLVFSQMERDGREIKLRNSSSDPLDIDGWKLVNVVSGDEFVFHDITLQPGESLTVRTGSDAKGEDDRNLAWPTEWNSHEDVCRIVDPVGVILYEQDIFPIDEDDSEVVDTKAEEDEQEDEEEEDPAEAAPGDVQVEAADDDEDGDEEEEDDEDDDVRGDDEEEDDEEEEEEQTGGSRRKSLGQRISGWFFS